MRKLVFAINTTIDGCCDHTKGRPDVEVHRYFTQLTKKAGALLYGRKTYELMVPFWPDIAKDTSGHPEDAVEFAKAFTSVPRMIVISKSLTKIEGKNSSILRSDLQSEIVKLKQESGGDILTGGVDVPTQLLGLGLIDEIHIVIHPVVAGEGRRLFDSLKIKNSLDFKLTESKVLKTGSVALHYIKN